MLILCWLRDYCSSTRAANNYKSHKLNEKKQPTVGCLERATETLAGLGQMPVPPIPNSARVNAQTCLDSRTHIQKVPSSKIPTLK